MAARETCKDCLAKLPPRSGRGRPPERCPQCQARRRHRRQPGKPREVRLSAVPEPPPGDDDDLDLDGPFPAPPVPTFTPVSVLDRVRRDLDALVSSHPAADTLGEVAALLAVTLDTPATRADPRAVAAVSKELRATLADLVRAEEAGNADPFGLDDVPAPVVVPTAG